MDDAGQTRDELLNETPLVDVASQPTPRFGSARVTPRFEPPSRHARNGLTTRRSKSATPVAATTDMHSIHLEPGSIAPSICSAWITVATTTIDRDFEPGDLRVYCMLADVGSCCAMASRVTGAGGR